MDIRKIKPTKLFWVDLEMTGLDPERDVILEVAAEVTDFNFKKLASYEAVVWQPDAALDGMTEWPKTQHGASGLTHRVRTEGRAEQTIRQELAEFIRTQFGSEPAILAGNSIHNDRIFIKKWWPDVDALLHYRMLDVTSFKIFMQGRYGIEYEKSDAHRAFDDIQASIAELQYYFELLKRPCKP